MSVATHTKELSRIFITSAKQIKLAKNEVIQSTDNNSRLTLIQQGYVKRYSIINDGSIRVQIVYGPRDIFPLTVAFKTLFGQDLYIGPEVYYYETMTETDLLVIDKNEIATLVKDNPLLFSDLFSEAGRRLYFNIQRLENIGLSTIYKRVAHQLVFYAQNFGELRPNGIKILLPLTQQDLADILSATRETVSLCMSDLRKLKLIKTGRNIIIPDIKKLQTEAFS